MIEEYYNSKAPYAEELSAYIQSLVLNGRQGFGLDGYSANANGIILSDLSEYSWEQIGRAVMTALEKDTYITPEERAERADAPKYFDDNNIKSEQLSFFSTTPSRQSIDEAFSELSDSTEELPATEKDGVLTFAEQVDKVLNGTSNRYDDLKVCDTPQILLDVGCEQLPMLYTQQHLKKAIQPKNLTKHTHGLDIEQIKNLPLGNR